jgi:hypothetical protein
VIVPKEVTLATVESELPGLRGYADRRGWRVDWRPGELVIVLDGTHPKGNPVRLRTEVDGYKALPPAWRFVSPLDGTPGKQHFPAPGPSPGGGASIFIKDAFICAPFNRLAYTGHGGPHGDWGGAANWLAVKQHVFAHTLGEMLAIIDSHLRLSHGMLP